MASSLAKELLESGIHFGHKASRWNPKMKPYILGKRNGVHLIDIRETVRGILRAKKYIQRVVMMGEDVLFVGTKRQARSFIEDHSQRCSMHYVSERWLGGTLTNFRTIRSRLSRLEELEAMEQDGRLFSEGKKTIARLIREKNKIKRNLDGIRRMSKLPGVLVIVDARHERNAVLEAKKLGIKTVCLLDTDSDPDLVDIPIPGNDDAMRAIDIVLKTLSDSVIESMQARPIEGEEVAPNAPSPTRRTRRPTTSQVAAEATPRSDADHQDAGSGSDTPDEVESSREEAESGSEEDSVAMAASNRPEGGHNIGSTQ